MKRDTGWSAWKFLSARACFSLSSAYLLTTETPKVKPKVKVQANHFEDCKASCRHARSSQPFERPFERSRRTAAPNNARAQPVRRDSDRFGTKHEGSPLGVDEAGHEVRHHLPIPSSHGVSVSTQQRVEGNGRQEEGQKALKTDAKPADQTELNQDHRRANNCDASTVFMSTPSFSE